jgi:hypothetical protein
MDPNELLAEILRRAEKVAAYGCSNCYADLLADGILRMDEWLSKGGLLPEAWKREPIPGSPNRGLFYGDD